MQREVLQLPRILRHRRRHRVCFCKPRVSPDRAIFYTLFWNFGYIMSFR